MAGPVARSPGRKGDHQGEALPDSGNVFRATHMEGEEVGFKEEKKLPRQSSKKANRACGLDFTRLIAQRGSGFSAVEGREGGGGKKILLRSQGGKN